MLVWHKNEIFTLFMKQNWQRGLSCWYAMLFPPGNQNPQRQDQDRIQMQKMAHQRNKNNATVNIHGVWSCKYTCIRKLQISYSKRIYSLVFLLFFSPDEYLVWIIIAQRKELAFICAFCLLKHCFICFL